MTALTAEQLTLMRADLGDTSTPPAFSDAELQLLWSLLGENWNLTVLRGIDQLLASSVKLTAYTQNQTQERKDQVFAHLEKLRGIWQAKVNEDIAARKANRQVKMVGLASQPAPTKDKPNA